MLNLGHTVGHALESASANASAPLLHGEAVALGLLAAARVGAGLGIGPADLEDRLRRLLARLGLPLDLDERLFALDRDREPTGEVGLRPEVRAALQVDKKRTDDQLRFIVLTRPGQAEVVPLQIAQLLALLCPPPPGR